MKDMFEREWDDLFPSIEDYIHSGAAQEDNDMTALEQTEQAINMGDYVVTYNDEIGKVTSPAFTDYDNGEQLVTVDVNGRFIQHGVAELRVATVEDAWNWLQSTNSYVEYMAKAFANELGLEIA